MSGKDSQNHKTDEYNIRHDEFLRLLMADQNRIYSFIVMCVPHRTDADDIMQETLSLMWRKFTEFELGTNFGSWGVQIARFKVWEYSRKNRRSPIQYESDMLETISDRAQSMQETLPQQLEILKHCVGKLPERDRNLVMLHYEKGVKVKDIALNQDRSVHTLYKLMNKIHHRLLICIRKGLLADEIS